MRFYDALCQARREVKSGDQHVWFGQGKQSGCRQPQRRQHFGAYLTDFGD